MARGSESQEEKIEEIYRALLGNLDNGGDGLIAQTRMMRKDIDETKKAVAAMSTTINKIERERIFSKGKQAGMLATSGLCGAGLIKLLDNLFK